MTMTHTERRSRQESVIADLEAGKTVRDVANEHGLSMNYIRSLAENAGVGPVKSPRRTISLKSLLIIAKLLGGEKQADVAREMQVTRAWISNLARRCVEAGIELPKSQDNEA